MIVFSVHLLVDSLLNTNFFEFIPSISLVADSVHCLELFLYFLGYYLIAPRKTNSGHLFEKGCTGNKQKNKRGINWI